MVIANLFGIGPPQLVIDLVDAVLQRCRADIAPAIANSLNNLAARLVL